MQRLCPCPNYRPAHAKPVLHAAMQSVNHKQQARHPGQLQGEADAIFMKKEAEAKGMYEILTKQALGLEQIVKAAGDNAKDAVLLLVADKLPELVRTQADAIKNIKIDKVTVWENGGGKDGKTSTSNFISGMYKAVPPLQEMFNMAGMQLPNYLKGEEIKNNDIEETIESTNEKE